MNRRSFIGTTGRGVGAVVVVGAAGQIACEKPSVEIEVSTAITFLKKVAVLIPGRGAIIGKIVTALDDFNKDYQAGHFDSAGVLFDHIDADFTQLIADLGVNLPAAVKIALALVDAAISAIAVLLKAKAPAVAGNLAAGQPGVAAVERRAAHAEALFGAIR